MPELLPSPEVGSRYRPILALGQGGMAEVHLAVGQGAGGFNKLLVLKLLRSELVADPAMPLQFLAEAQISARMNHPNVVQVYEIIDAARPCIVMEYLEGQSLSAVQQLARDEFTTAMQLRVISDALAGLHYSHELRDYDGTPLDVVHRDVSPQNIFITYDGVVKVLDFGIAKASSMPGSTTTGILKGKIRYMSREQMMGERVDRRADVFAAGCLLWQAATHTRLWDNQPDGVIMRRLIAGDVTPPSSVRNVDPELERIIMKALASAPEDRFPTAQALRTALDAYSSRVYPNCTMRDVAAFLCEKFADRRQTCARQIQAALAAAPTSSRSGPNGAARPSSTPIAASATVPGAADRTQPDVRPARRPWVWRTAPVGLALIVGAIAATTGGGRRDRSERSPRLVELHLDVAPRNAVVTLDGKPVRENPSDLKVTSDPAEHELRVLLDGYVPLVRTLRAERDLSLELALEKNPPSTEARWTAKEAVDNPSSTETIDKQSGREPVDKQSGRESIDNKASKAANSRQNATTSKPKTTACDPPFFFAHGIKKYKPGCL